MVLPAQLGSINQRLCAVALDTLSNSLIERERRNFALFTVAGSQSVGEHVLVDVLDQHGSQCCSDGADELKNWRLNFCFSSKRCTVS